MFVGKSLYFKFVVVFLITISINLMFVPTLLKGFEKLF